MLLYQDYQAAPDRAAFLLQLVRETRCSGDFRTALEAEAYFRGENPTVARKTILKRARSKRGTAPGAGAHDV